MRRLHYKMVGAESFSTASLFHSPHMWISISTPYIEMRVDIRLTLRNTLHKNEKKKHLWNLAAPWGQITKRILQEGSKLSLSVIQQ